MVARFEEDDYPGQDREVVVDGDTAYVLPRAARRLSPDSRQLLGEVQAIALEVSQLEAQLAHLTDIGREQGISWSLLGAAQGLTGEALRRRSVEDS